MYDGRTKGLPHPYLRAWLTAALAILACLTLGLSTATATAADEAEGGGGELPPVETPVDPPAEPELPPAEPTTPTEAELPPSESPKITPESPPHPGEAPSESSSPGPSAPIVPTSQTPGGSGRTPARNHSSGGSSAPPKHTSGGTGKGIKVTNPVNSISSGVNDLFSGALAPKQLDRVGKLLADSGLAPRGDKKAQREAARKIINALGVAALGSGIGLSPPKASPGPQPIPFVPIHGAPNYLSIVLLILLLAGVALVLFYQLRPVIRSRQSRPPLISGLDTGVGTGAGPGRVALPREPARAPERPNPGRRKTR